MVLTGRNAPVASEELKKFLKDRATVFCAPDARTLEVLIQGLRRTRTRAPDDYPRDESLAVVLQQRRASLRPEAPPPPHNPYCVQRAE